MYELFLSYMFFYGEINVVYEVLWPGIKEER